MTRAFNREIIVSRLRRPRGARRRIASPLPGVTYALRRSRPDGVIAPEASAVADVQSVFWFDGGAPIGKLPVGAGAFAWRPTADGAQPIRVIDGHGRAAERDVQAPFAQ